MIVYTVYIYIYRYNQVVLGDTVHVSWQNRYSDKRYSQKRFAHHFLYTNWETCTVTTCWSKMDEIQLGHCFKKSKFLPGKAKGVLAIHLKNHKRCVWISLFFDFTSFKISWQFFVLEHSLMPSMSLIALLDVLSIYSRAHLASSRLLGGGADSNQRACCSKAQRARSVFDAGKEVH